MKDGLLGSKVDTWSSHRKIISQSFKYKSYLTYYKYVYDGGKKLTETACNVATQTGGGVLCGKEMGEIIHYSVFQIAAHIFMGSECFNFSDEKRYLFYKNFRTVKDVAVYRFHQPELLVPFLWWLLPSRQTLERCTDSVIEISNQITNNYRKKMDLEKRECEEGIVSRNASPRSDVDENIGIKRIACPLEMMIKSGCSNKEISDEIATFLTAGQDTVKVALDMLTFQLALNKEHQKKCQVEVDELFNSCIGKVDGHLDLEDFSSLKHLEMCILESLRLTPVVPAFARELQETLQIDECVMVLVWTLHRNPLIYPNPETYDPSKFLPENVKHRHPYSFIPFSMGARNCIGWKVALMEIKVIMAWILRYFEMDTTDKPEDVKILFDVDLKLERPYNVTFKIRG